MLTPAASQACMTVEPDGTSTGRPSTSTRTVAGGARSTADTPNDRRPTRKPRPATRLATAAATGSTRSGADADADDAHDDGSCDAKSGVERTACSPAAVGTPNRSVRCREPNIFSP